MKKAFLSILVVFGILFFSCNSGSNKSGDDFDAFFKEFKNAALEDNHDEMATLLSSDDLWLTNEELVSNWDFFFSQEYKDSLTNKKASDAIRDIPFEGLEDNLVTVIEFSWKSESDDPEEPFYYSSFTYVFKKIEGSWRFVAIGGAG